MKNKNSLFANLGKVRRLFVYFSPYWKYAVLAGGSMLFAVLLQLPLPLVTRHIIDTILPSKNLLLLNWVVLALLAFTVFKGLADIVNGYYLTLFKEYVLYQVQLDLFRHIQNLDIGFFKNNQSGYLSSRITGDVSNLNGLLATTLLNLVKDCLTFVVGAVIILMFHWKLALLAMLTLPFFVQSLTLFSRRMKENSTEFQEKFSLIHASIQENFSAVDVTKIFQLEGSHSEKLSQRMKSIIQTAIKINVTFSLSSFFTNFIGTVGPLVVLWYGGREVIAGRLSLGTLVAFSSFLGYLLGPAQRMTTMNMQIQTSLASLDRVFQLLDTPSRVPEPSTPQPLPAVSGTLRFHDLSFAYEDGRTVLDHVDFTARPGQVTAIVGKSGAGKTTLINLILRFYDPGQGCVTLDDIDIRDVSLADLRRHIAVVPQDTFLFSTTVMENIRCGKPEASDEEVAQAIHAANAGEFIDKLPSGLETMVGERGTKLSGGQKQRLALARAILKDPRILILDEATSDLDADSERFIQEALQGIMKNRTSLIIAHRFSTILQADQILFIEDGRIIAAGRHQELFRSCEAYRRLCENQFIKTDAPIDGVTVIPAAGKTDVSST